MFILLLTLYFITDNLDSFNGPVDIQQQGDLVYIVEQRGTIMVFDRVNPSSTDTFLDIRSDVDTSGSEEGLLGLAFHPNFNSNGEFFVYYSRAGESATVLSRFNIQSGNPRNAQESSEEILLTIDQPFSNHNGGQIQFGPDGFLYIAGKYFN